MSRKTLEPPGFRVATALIALLALGAPATSKAVRASAQPVADQPALSYAELLAKAEAEGYVRVIVGVATARGFEPEGYLPDPHAVENQRQSIALAQQALLDNLSSFDVKVKATYQFVPFLAITVDQAALEFLVASAASGIVTSIEEDVFFPPTLASTIPVVGADDAWARGYEGGGQTVAILDTGIEKHHSFFGGSSSRVVSEACYSTKDLANGIIPLCPNGQTSQVGSGSANANTSACYSGPGTTGDHLCQHGTHVAGIAAGEGVFFSGVARSAEIIAIQVFTRVNNCVGSDPCVRSYVSDFNLGLERVYALRTTHDIAAANLSLGGGGFTAPCNTVSEETILTKESIDTLRSGDIATVISSGNDYYSNALSFPACISTAISVAASTDSDSVWFSWPYYGSNVAYFLDLFAPGASVTSSIPGGSFAKASGTSMAAPHVAGAWAVLKQASPSSTVNQIRSALVSTGVPITRAGITKPRIQIDAALDTLVRTLSVTKLGTGTGSVTSTPAGISCGSVCDKEFTKGSTVQLNASPAGDSEFSGWGGHSDCLDGSVTMNVDKTCTASFDLKPLLTVTRDGDGVGTVTSSPPGISCGVDCTHRYSSGTVVRLTATAAAGSSFLGWGGDCVGGSVSMNSDKGCVATFMLHRLLTVGTSGTGSGTVTSSPGGVNCGGDCSEYYPYGMTVSLAVVPDIGSEFAGWSGHEDCADGRLTMDADKSCDASLEPCTIASQVTVSDVTISETGIIHQACNKLIVGPDVLITGTGEVEFRAGNSVEFVQPVTVEVNCEMSVVMGPPVP